MVTANPLSETTKEARKGGEIGGIRVLLVDDHHVVREGLRRILELEPKIQVVGDARSGDEAIMKAVSLSPNVIVMDLKMPGMDGITATREIKQKMPEINILMLTLYGEDFVKQAIEAGASGYLLKDSDCEQITEAIVQVNDGLYPIAPSLTRQLLKDFSSAGRETRQSALTKRQSELLKLIAKGMNSKEIGSHLLIGTSKTKKLIRQILDKLEVDDPAQTVALATKRKLI